ncbi:F-box domain-containing protein [Apiospora phragmitis]|uniref:F-box domain-containing protein n=1 Tax=Apiospora phragmitis TaxID=2905665 RepID=A0ABR1UIQ6_9PEZI
MTPETKDIIHFQRCSRRLLKLSRDNVFWRTRCLLTSSFLEGINLRRGVRLPNIFEGALSDDAASQDHHSSDREPIPPLDFPWASRGARKKEIQKITANWDPSFPGETISWYDEYIHRNSPISVSWFERPQLRDGGLKDTIEVKGVAVYQHGDEEVFAVSPSMTALLLRMGSSKSPYLSPDCVSVDNARGRAFFAVQGHVVEVDLGTLQVGSLHSGARLCSLTSLPYPFSGVDSELRRKGELSIEQVEKIKETTGGRTLVACGEYNTKGSLEIYGLGPPLPGQESYGVSLNSVMKNRQTASKSKLLSVINHGTCLVVSDGQGYLKWVERDGFTEVRRHYIGPTERVVDHPSLFTEMPGSGEIARKLLSTQSRQASDDKSNDDDILLWTGEKLGLVNFSSKQGFTADDFEEGDTRTPEEVAVEKEKQRYEERMRQALERDADGVRLFKVLGAGIGG